MAKALVEPGADIDGFTVGECVHRGGMATLWSVTRPDIAAPLLMKIPRVSEGEDPAAIVSFEMEQMILPRLSGPHVPACFGTGDFTRQPYVAIERIPLAKANTTPDVSDVVGGGVYRWRSIGSRSGSGVIGNPEAATVEKGHRLFDVISSALAEKLCNPELWELPWTSETVQS